MKKLLFVCLLCIFTAYACGGGGGSSGSEDGIKALNAIRDNPSGDYVLTGDVELTGVWEPIEGFTGTFDGAGHVISGLNVGATGGLFADLQGDAVVKNLGVQIDGCWDGGGIAGKMYDNSSIDNSYTTGSVSCNSSFGAIVGYMYDGSVNNSYSTGNITITNADSVDVGGIAGASGGSINNSYSEMNISVTVDSSAFVGGIVGYGEGSVNNSYSTGDISAAADNVSVGGIAGTNYGSSIKNSYSAGDIIATAIDNAQAGGIVGDAHDSLAINNSYSTGDISATADIAYAGGILGGSYSGSDITIDTSYSAGNISATGAYPYAGGIAGFIYGDITNSVAINPTIYAVVAAYAYRICSGNGVNNNNFALDTMDDTGAPFDTQLPVYGIDKTEVELKTKETYSDPTDGGGLGWKFGNDDDNPWKMPVGGGYPILYWQ